MVQRYFLTNPCTAEPLWHSSWKIKQKVFKITEYCGSGKNKMAIQKETKKKFLLMKNWMFFLKPSQGLDVFAHKTLHYVDLNSVKSLDSVSSFNLFRFIALKYHHLCHNIFHLANILEV